MKHLERMGRRMARMAILVCSVLGVYAVWNMAYATADSQKELKAAELDVRVSERALREFIDDCLDCGTYLVISAEGMEKQQNVATGNKLRGIAKQFFDLATQPAIYIKMKPETFQVLIEQTLEKHGELVGYNFSNFSLLMNQYHDACEALRGAPDQHLVELRQEILAQELKKLP